MRRKPKVCCSSCVALVDDVGSDPLMLDGSSAAPILRSASELMADDGKTLAVGPGKPEDNAVLVVGDSNKLSFTMFRPSCLEDGNGFKEINSEIWLENGCKMYITWGRSSIGEKNFNVLGGNVAVKVPGFSGPAQVDLDGNSAEYGFPGVLKGAALCMLNLRKVPDGNGYLANISLRGTPECEVKALFKYKQYKPLLPENPGNRPSNSLSTPAIVGISVGVVGAIAVLGLISLLLYCFRVSEEEEREQKQPAGGDVRLGQKKPSKTTQPAPPKQSDQGKKKSAEPVAIVVEPPEEEVFKPKSQPKHVIKPKSQLKQVIKPSVSEEVPKSPPMPKGVLVGYCPEDCVRAVSLEKSLSPNTETKKEIAKVQEEFESIRNGDLVGIGLKAEMQDHIYWTRLSDQYVPRRQLIGMDSIANDPRNMTPEQKKLEKTMKKSSGSRNREDGQDSAIGEAAKEAAEQRGKVQPKKKKRDKRMQLWMRVKPNGSK
uniref:Uncharacterized protein n=1 Tax=Ditylenchus dipsaci TaxID=166011 RepID=A0A915DXV9_9BILA